MFHVELGFEMFHVELGSAHRWSGKVHLGFAGDVCLMAQRTLTATEGRCGLQWRVDYYIRRLADFAEFLSFAVSRHEQSFREGVRNSADLSF